MPLIRLKLDPTLKELRYFGLIAIPLLMLIISFLLRHSTIAPTWYWIAAIMVVLAVVISVIAPRALRYPFAAWMLLTFPIGWVLSHVLLAVTFFLVLTPIALVLRLLGHDPLHLKGPASENSNWEERKPPEDKSRYFRQW